MIIKSRLLVALLAVPAILVAGCASTVAGDAKPATTFSNPPTTSSSEVSTTSSSVESITTSSEIPPVPPSSVTTESSDTSTESSNTETSESSETTESSETSETSDTIGGVSIPDVLEDLGDDNVALVNSSADADALAAEVSSARTAGLELSVVSIGDKIDDSDAGDIADAVFKEIKGTVLVLTPTLVTSRSDQLTSAQLKTANKAASSGSDDLSAVQKYVASAVGNDVPSTTTSKKTTSAAPSKDMVNGVDVKALAAAAATDGVAVQAGVTGVDKDALENIVTSAKSKGLDLTIFILKNDVTGHLYDVADGVKKYTKDTVIGMSPTVYAISSDDFTNAQLQAAIDAASDATTYEEVATKMTASLLSN